jgi:hypothetical protein
VRLVCGVCSVGVIAPAEIEGQQIVVGTVGKMLDTLQPRGAKPKLSVAQLKIVVRCVG